MFTENRVEQENNPEKFPTKEEIILGMGLEAEKCEVTEKSDEQGIYYLEARVEGEDGKYWLYDYRRKGEFDTQRSSGNAIHLAEYDKDGEFVKNPEHIAEYNQETGGWDKV